jgi:hypothetical protein
MNEKTIDRTDALLKLERDDVSSADVPPAEAAVRCEDTLEAMYQKIGWWKGPNATADARTLVCDFWRNQGDHGLRWLVSRLRPEGHIDLLDGVASILAQIGATAIPPVLDELERQPSRDHAEALLKALGWLGEQGNAASPPLVARLGLVLATFLSRDDPGLREWAARAAGLLPRERAVGLLSGRLNAEPDADVRHAIQETVAASAAK